MRCPTIDAKLKGDWKRKAQVSKSKYVQKIWRDIGKSEGVKSRRYQTRESAFLVATGRQLGKALTGPNCPAIG